MYDFMNDKNNGHVCRRYRSILLIHLACYVLELHCHATDIKKHILSFKTDFKSS